MSSIMKGIIDEAEAFDYDRLKAMPAKERIAYLRDKPELRNLYNAEFQKRIDAELNNYSWMTPEEKAHYEKLASADDTSQGMQSKSFSAEKYLKQLFQKKMDAKKAASMLKVHWAPLEDLQKYLTGQISTKTELSAYLAKSPEDLGKLRWGSGTIGIVVDGHITIGGRGDLGSDQYKTVNGVRGQQKYASRPGQIDPTFDTLDLGKHHEVLVDNWKIREIVLPPDIPENVDGIIKKAGIPVRRLANQEQPINEEELDENLRKWFKEKWVRFGPDGKIRGACARGSDKEGKPKCLPQSKAHSLGKKGRKYAAAKKRREDPNPERRGKAKNVATKKKSNEEIQVNEKWSQKYKDSINCSNPKGFSQKAHCAGKKKNEDMNEGIPFNQCPECRGPIVHESMINEKKDACYHKVKARYKVWPSAYASGALVQCRKKGASNWGTGGKKKNESSIMKGLVDEGVIIGHDANDPDVAVLGGAGSYKLSNLKKKAQMEANELAKDVSEGKFKNSAYNVKQLANTLNTIVAAEEEMEKGYFGEDYTGEFAAEKTPAINPYGGKKDRQFRGAISETPTDNPTGASGEGGWRKYKPKPAGELDEDTAYAGGMGQGGNAGQSYRKFKPKSAGTFKEDEQLDEKCWKGYKKQGTKKMFGKTYPNCVKNTNEDLSRTDVDDIERFADKLYKKLGIDVTFTKHFMDRVNDERNGKPISGAELVRLFKKEYDRWGKQVAQMGPDEEGTFKDLLTDINLPFVLRWDRDEEELDLIAKTVMRKKNFKTHNQEFPIDEGEEQLDEKCWDTHKQVGMKKKGGKMVPNCVPKESAIMKGLKL